MRQALGNVLTGTLVVCAVAMSAVAVHREFSDPDGAPAPQIQKSHVPGGASLALEGQLVGAPHGSVTLVAFSDFECPYCGALDNALRELRRRHPTEVRVVYRHFPLPVHRHAMVAALASECAALQGRFDEFAGTLFAKQDSLGMIAWADLASRAGVADTASFERCRLSQDGAAHVRRDQNAGARLSLRATPAILLGDEMIVGAPTLTELEGWVASAHGSNR